MIKFVYNDKANIDKRKHLRNNATDCELLLWQHLKSKQLLGLKFVRQYSIGIYILDFYCPARRLGIELDGGQHAEEKTKEYDAKRTEYLKGHGITLLRFWNTDITSNLDPVLQVISTQIC